MNDVRIAPLRMETQGLAFPWCEFLLINVEKINSLYLTYFTLMSSQIKLSAFRALLLVWLATFHTSVLAQAAPAKTLQYSVFYTFAHDTKDFTQGLVIDDGRLFESTGGYGSSALYEKGLRSGKVVRSRKLAQNFFGEGLAALNGRLYQLSWQNGLGFIYDYALKPHGTFNYSTEGWGLTTDGTHLIMSDGTSTLSWLDASTQRVTKRIEVRDGFRPVTQLNELEYVDGFIYANVWMTDFIAQIDAESGQVIGWLDLSALKKGFAKPPGWNEREHVLNGIAYDRRSKHFFVTGKCWPVLFEISISQ